MSRTLEVSIPEEPLELDLTPEGCHHADLDPLGGLGLFQADAAFRGG